MNLTMTNGETIIVRSIFDKETIRKACTASQGMKNMNLKTAGAIRNPRTIAEIILKMFEKSKSKKRT